MAMASITVRTTSNGLGNYKDQFAPDPQRALRRADNLSSPTGQLAYKESVPLEAIIDEDAPLVQTPTQLSRKGFRASIHRTLESVGKLVRSKSLGLTTSSPAKKNSGNGTGVGISRPQPLRSFSTSVVSSPSSSSKPNGHGISANGVTRRSRRVVSESRPTKEPVVVEDDDAGESAVDIPVPLLLVEGTPMLKMSNKKQDGGFLRVDPELGQLIWQRKKRRIISLECIKELRTGAEVRYYREQFEHREDTEGRWISIFYMDEGEYKTLHLVALTSSVYELWKSTLEKLHAVRKQLMSGLGNAEIREALWAKQYWKAGDEVRDNRLEFDEVKKLCRRLCISLGAEELHRLFKLADSQNRDYLDFEDFLKFGKLLKYRPEIDRLHKKLEKKGDGIFSSHVFERFMKEEQKSHLSQEEIHALFEKYSEPISESAESSPKEHKHFHFHKHPPSPSSPSSPSRRMTCAHFQAFLMSPDNSAFTDQHQTVWQDMTRPISDYYISSSHNTYLVGHQLIGDSTIEGYIRALLHSCRSVEVDIYADPPSDPEPMITHGGTLTSKVPLRAVCQAINQFGFIMSPYPIVISAEMHATVAGQEEVAKILVEVFGERLVRRRMEGEEGEAEGDEIPEVIEQLPSPEKLKYKILFKTKNLNLVHAKSVDDATSTPSLDSSDTTESEVVLSDSQADIPSDPNTNSEAAIRRASRRRSGGEAIAAFRKDVMKAGTSLVHRMRSVGHSGHHRSASQSVEPSSRPVIDRPRTSLSLPRPDLLNYTSEPTSVSGPGAGAGTVYKPEQATDSITNVISGAPSTPPLENGEGTTTLVRRLSKAVRSASPTRDLLSPGPSTPKKPKVKTAPTLAACLVYTVGVKCRGINKKEFYAPEHMFSLSENTANKMIDSRPGPSSASGHSSAETVAHGGDLVRRGSTHSDGGKAGMHGLIKHCRTHLVRIYPKGLRFSSSNYQPHRFWCAGAQLVAINWQTKDLGYMINYAMFQRNGRSGYVLKPKALRGTQTSHHDVTPASIEKLSLKKLLNKRTRHVLHVKIISAQQLPRPKDSNGIETANGVIDPFVEVSVHTPDWPATKGHSRMDMNSPHKGRDGALAPPPMAHANSTASSSSSASKVINYRTSIVKNNGFNPRWEETLLIPFECVGEMQDLVFVRFAVGQGDYKDEIDPLAVYCTSLGSLGHGYRHIPLHDTQMSQYLFSTLFVKISIEDQ